MSHPRDLIFDGWPNALAVPPPSVEAGAICDTGVKVRIWADADGNAFGGTKGASVQLVRPDDEFHVNLSPDELMAVGLACIRMAQRLKNPASGG